MNIDIHLELDDLDEVKHTFSFATGMVLSDQALLPKSVQLIAAKVYTETRTHLVANGEEKSVIYLENYLAGSMGILEEEMHVFQDKVKKRIKKS
jgi:hypothetical protein